MNVPNFSEGNEIADSLRELAAQMDRREVIVTRIDFCYSASGAEAKLDGKLELEFCRLIRQVKK